MDRLQVGGEPFESNHDFAKHTPPKRGDVDVLGLEAEAGERRAQSRESPAVVAVDSGPG
jgi:hypothetical protein